MKMKELEDQHSLDVQKEPEDWQLAQFLAVLRKFQVNISFEKGEETMMLTKECNVLVQRKLPQKMPNPGSFLISCTIGIITFKKALCDLGSSINLMSFSVMNKLGIQEVQPTKISLEMADKSLKKAYRLVENVLVKVEDLYLPASFVLLDTG
ncbi:uncharacterized protein LOC107620727 [Arachis ipaensis]|uniref:uncharacterized protein LOC107620727 n=1 Tax=Arachis ipaensis TaxID=130454 RepID=UPI0007AF3831|nr:uncharacterized protein LOC107620727 [Arachis ipaensis]